jgi:hypothetical protein
LLGAHRDALRLGGINRAHLLGASLVLSIFLHKSISRPKASSVSRRYTRTYNVHARTHTLCIACSGAALPPLITTRATSNRETSLGHVLGLTTVGAGCPLPNAKQLYCVVFNQKQTGKRFHKREKTLK